MKRHDGLKVIALVSMLIDHLGLIFFPEEPTFRMIGRLAFPLYAYYLAQGFQYTKSRKNYFVRLLVFGLISQVPYVFLNEAVEVNLWQVNQVPMLLYAALVLLVLEQGKKATSWLPRIGFVSLAIGLAFVPDALMFYLPELQLGYGNYGILLSLMFWWFDGRWVALGLGFLALSYFYPYRYFVEWANPNAGFLEAWFNVKANVAFYRQFPPFWSFTNVWNQNYAMFSLPLIYLAQRWPSDWRLNKWLAYWFYPGHIALLVIAYHLIHG